MFLRHFFLLIIFFTLGIALFANSFGNQFMIDDYIYFDLGKTHAPKSFKQIFLPSAMLPGSLDMPGQTFYRPLASALPELCFKFFGTDPRGYHVVNTLLWSLAAFLAYVLLMKVFNDPWLAGCASVVYLVHPINGLVVNYCTASVFAAQTIFMLLALISFPLVGRSREGAAWSVVFFILSLMCHETALILPIYVFLIVKITGSNKSWQHAIKAVSPLLIVAVVYVCFRLFVVSWQRFLSAKLGQYDMTMLDYAWGFVQLAGWYVQQLFSPGGVVFMYAVPMNHVGFVTGKAGQAGVWPFIALIALGFLTWRFRKQAPPLFGLLLLWAGFLPLVAGMLITPLQGFFMEPHWLVFPSLGFFIFIGWLLSQLRQKMGIVVGWVAAVFLVLSLGILTLTYNRLWHDQKNYCLYWRGQCQELATAAYFLGDAFFRDRQFDLAREHYNASLLGRYKDWMVYLSLAQLESAAGNFTKAKHYYHLVLERRPVLSEALNGLGAVYARERDWPHAEHYFNLASVHGNGLLPSLMNLARLCELQNDAKGAAGYYRKVLTLNRGYEPAMIELLRYYIFQNDMPQALPLAQQLAATGKNARGLTIAASVLAHEGQIKTSQAAFEAAIKADPNFKDAYTEYIKLCIKINDQSKAMVLQQQRNAL